MTLGGRFWEYLKVTPSLLSSNGRHGSTGYLYTVVLTGMEFHSKPATRVMACNAVGTSAKTNVCLQGITIFIAEASGSPRVNGNLQWLCSNRTLPRKAKQLIGAPQLQPTMQTQTSQRHDPKISQATSIHWIHTEYTWFKIIQNYSSSSDALAFWYCDRSIGKGAWPCHGCWHLGLTFYIIVRICTLINCEYAW